MSMCMCVHSTMTVNFQVLKMLATLQLNLHSASIVSNFDII